VSLSVESPISAFRVQKAKTNGTLQLSNGSSVQGSFFVAGSSAMHAGPERVKDVLNAEPGFFPFEVLAAGASSQTILYNREHVVFVELTGNYEAMLEPGYQVAPSRAAEMLLSSGTRLHGVVRIYRPQGSDRLSDFARSSDQFLYLETPAATYLVNARHLIALVEENS